MATLKQFLSFLGRLIVKDGKFTPLFIPFLAFALSVASAFIINAFIQNSIIERQEKFVMNRRNLDQAEQTLVNVSNLVNERISSLIKIQSALENRAPNSIIKKDWVAYEGVRTTWEIKDMAYRFKLKTYYGTGLACDFWQGVDKQSAAECCKDCITLYDSFESAEKSTYSWKKCFLNTFGPASQAQQTTLSTSCNTDRNESVENIESLETHARNFLNRLYLGHVKFILKKWSYCNSK